MSTRIGFFLFLGSILGALIGQFVFKAAGFGAIAGFIIAIIWGYILDRKDPANSDE